MALIVILNSSENFVCSWSCHESPSAAKRACNDPMRFWRSRLKRCSSSAKRLTCSGSMIACGINVLSLCGVKRRLKQRQVQIESDEDELGTQKLRNGIEMSVPHIQFPSCNISVCFFPEC